MFLKLLKNQPSPKKKSQTCLPWMVIKHAAIKLYDTTGTSHTKIHTWKFNVCSCQAMKWYIFMNFDLNKFWFAYALLWRWKNVLNTCKALCNFTLDKIYKYRAIHSPQEFIGQWHVAWIHIVHLRTYKSPTAEREQVWKIWVFRLVPFLQLVIHA
jgi:hypothetical protein